MPNEAVRAGLVNEATNADKIIAFLGARAIPSEMKMSLPWIVCSLIAGWMPSTVVADETRKTEPAAQRGLVVSLDISRTHVDVTQASSAGQKVHATITLFNRSKDARQVNFPHSAVQPPNILSSDPGRPVSVSGLPVASERFAFRLVDSLGHEVWRSTASVPGQPAQGRNGVSLGYSLFGVTEALKGKGLWTATVSLPVEVDGHLLYRDSYQVEAWLTGDPRIRASGVLEVTGGAWPPIPGQNVTGNLLRIDETGDAGQPTGGYVRLQQLEGTGTFVGFDNAIWARGDGTFQLSLPPGRYRANPVDTPATDTAGDLFYHPPVFGPDVDFTVREGESVELDFVMGHPPAPLGSPSGIRGIVTASPIYPGPWTFILGATPGGLTQVPIFFGAGVVSGFKVLVKQRIGATEGEIVYQGITDALGRYQVPLSSGDYRVQLGEPPPISGIYYVGGYWYETTDVTVSANDILYRHTDFDTGIQ